MSVVILSTGYYPDPDIGKPIANGYIYVGVVDLDPEIVANQKTISVLQEDGSEVAVAQPLRTSAGGVPNYNGSPVTIIAASPYSLKVNNSAGSQKIYSPSNTGSSQANEDWSEEGAAVAFDSASTLTVAGDVTADYVTHRAVRLTQTTDDTGFVVSSVFGGGVTTVTVRAATVDSGLTTVEYGIEVAASPGGSSEDFHANIVGDLTGDVTGDLTGNADTATKVGVLNVKVVDIGDWDMDAVDQTTITHGIADFTKIRSIQMMIRADTGLMLPASNGYDNAGIVPTTLEVSTNSINATEIVIARKTGGRYDSIGYDQTSYNRGWITIWYID